MVRHKPWPAEVVLDKPRHQLTNSALFSHSVVSPLRYPGRGRSASYRARAPGEAFRAAKAWAMSASESRSSRMSRASLWPAPAAHRSRVGPS
jgi:hypothetical protein